MSQRDGIASLLIKGRRKKADAETLRFVISIKRSSYRGGALSNSGKGMVFRHCRLSPDTVRSSLHTSPPLRTAPTTEHATMYGMRGRSVLVTFFLCWIGAKMVTVGADASYSIAQEVISNDCLFPQRHSQMAGTSDLTAAFYRTSTETEEAAHRVEDKTDRDHLSLRRSTSNDNGSREEGTSTDNIPSAHEIPARNPPVEWSHSVDIPSTRGSSHEECSGGGDGDSSSPSHDAILGNQGKPQLQQQSEGVISGKSGDHDHENRSPATRKVTKRAWEGVKVVMERSLHVFREIKAVFSSELERCLLKATRPEDMAVDEACMQALLAQANILSAVEARFDCDPHEVMCSKLFKKMMEKDWRTIAKALYVIHRLQRDSPAKDAARFAAFFREKWADGAGELGRHVRREGGENAPWLKVYSGYLAARGRGMDTALNAFHSWETLTSIRQLRNGLAEANALLTRVLALHFAGDASSPGLGGGNVRRACCGLAFQDAVDVRAMVYSTGRPPALLWVPGLGVDLSESQDEESVAAWTLGEDDCSVDTDAVDGGPLSMGRESLEAAGVTETGVENGPTLEASAGADGTKESENVSSDRSCPAEAGSVMEGEGDGVGIERVPEGVLEAAKECTVFEEVSGVVTAVYSSRYGSEERESVSAMPLWVRQLAAVARRAGPGPHGLDDGTVRVLNDRFAWR